MVRVDDTNLEILRLLQEDGRMTLADLARHVGRSESTVRERVISLERSEVLTGYRAQVDWAKAGLPATAVVRARCDMNRVAEATKSLLKLPNVTRALLTTGPRPVLVHLRVRDIQHLQSLLREHLSTGQLTDVEAELALETLVEARPPALPPNGTAPSKAAAIPIRSERAAGTFPTNYARPMPANVLPAATAQINNDVA